MAVGISIFPSTCYRARRRCTVGVRVAVVVVCLVVLGLGDRCAAQELVESDDHRVWVDGFGPHVSSSSALNFNIQLLGEHLYQLEDWWDRSGVISYGGFAFAHVSAGVLGAIQILSGLAVASGSIALDVLTEETRFAPYGITLGSGYALQGIFTLALTPDLSEDYLAFRDDRASTSDGQMMRLLRGERALEHAASRAKTLRLVNASIDMALDASIPTIYFIQNDFEMDTVGWVLTVFSGISFAFNAVQLFSQTEPEYAWEHYKRLRKKVGGVRLTPMAHISGSRISLGVSGRY